MTNPPVVGLADVTGDQLLALIHYIHSAHVESVAAAFNITDESGLSQLREAPDKESMLRIAQTITEGNTR